jgi:hypothetical protein
MNSGLRSDRRISSGHSRASRYCRHGPAATHQLQAHVPCPAAAPRHQDRERSEPTHRQRSGCEDFKEDPRREQKKEHRAASLYWPSIFIIHTRVARLEGMRPKKRGKWCPKGTGGGGGSLERPEPRGLTVAPAPHFPKRLASTRRGVSARAVVGSLDRRQLSLFL